MNCVICEKPIHPKRIEAQPRCKTCGHECSKEHTKRVRAKIHKRWREGRRQNGGAK